jgi:wobble nucleotide-excising tRNase
MIKRIQYIKNFGVYKNYRHSGTLPDFNNKNMIYGWNYSGKTTLSRLFSFMENKKTNSEEFPDIEFEIILENGTKIDQANIGAFPFNVRVFNSDFIKDNLRFDSDDKKMKGITFDIGENAHLRPLIVANEEYIAKARLKITDNSVFINRFNEFSASKFTNQARIIKNDHFNSLIEFNKGHLERLIGTKEEVLNNIILDQAILIKIKADSISKNDKDKIDIGEYAIKLNDLIQKVSDFISKEPKAATQEEILDDDSDLYNWVRTGVRLHESKHLENCAFCKSDLTPERVMNLNTYFSNEAAVLKDESVELINKINAEIEYFEKIDIRNKSKNDLNESLQSIFEDLVGEYSTVCKEYCSVLNQLKSIIEDKLTNSLFVAKTLPEMNTEVESILSKWITDVKKVFEEHNQIVENFKSNQDSARDSYKKHLVSKYLIDENYFEFKRKKEIEEKYHQIFNARILAKEIENKEYSDQLQSITAGKGELNRFIKMFLKREDIQIDVTYDNHFVLKRGDIIAKNLSEGEKTAIAFSHFMVMLDSLFESGKLLETIVFFDDPISSLDANHIAQITSLINSFFFRKGIDPDNPTKVIDCFLQLFVSTHNFEFYSFLRDANNIKRKKKIQTEQGTREVPACDSFFIKKVAVDSSIIEKMPSSLASYKSEYIYLFSLIYDFFESDCSIQNPNYILMPNAVRRFLEIYTLIKLPGNKGEIDSRIVELVGDVNELKILHHFSHFTSFEKATRHDELILRLPEVVADVFTLLGNDMTHYESLCTAINKTVFVVENS